LQQRSLGQQKHVHGLLLVLQLLQLAAVVQLLQLALLLAATLLLMPAGVR
jgi:hypothetical protein